MEIADLVKIHDKSQFEIKLGYFINPALNKTEYKIEMYFFLPKNLKINKYTYTKKEFYEDFSNYIRLTTPKQSLKSLINRLDTLQHFLESYKDAIDNHFEKINYELKIIICSYRAYIRDFSKSMGINGNKDEVIRELINDINAFRKKVGKIRGFSKYAKEVLLKNLFLFSDEYSSLVTEVYLFRLFNMLSCEIDANIIKKAIESEVNHRKKHKMSYIGENDEQNEDVIYRYSVFKKYFYSILFLFCKRQEDSVTLKHIFYAIAVSKVYHINVIIKFSSIDYCELNKVRLILTKKGIKRIELPEHDISLI